MLKFARPKTRHWCWRNGVPAFAEDERDGGKNQEEIKWQ